MFPKEDFYSTDPFLIKRQLDGKDCIFNVNPFTYDSESGWVMLLDLETKALYRGVVIDNRIEVISRLKITHAASYEEFIFSAYNKNNNKNLFNTY